MTVGILGDKLLIYEFKLDLRRGSLVIGADTVIVREDFACAYEQNG